MRPYFRTRNPTPPPSVIPPIPTVPASPNPVASPWAPAATVYSRCGEPGTDPRGAPFDVDVERAQIRQIELDPAVGAAVTGAAVTAAPHGELESGVLRVRDRPDDVVRAAGADDDRRPEVVSAVEHRPGLVVPGIARHDDAAVEAGIELGDGC